MSPSERSRLSEIIEEDNGTNWWNPEEFKVRVRGRLPVELNIVSIPPSPSGNFNCFVYALGLENDPEFLGGKNPIQQEFIRYLFDKGILQTPEHSSASDLVFYEDSAGTITHGGIVQADGSILSKWMWGALFSHKLMDVPSSFGDKIFYAYAIDPKDAKQAYIEYKNTGVVIEPIG